MENINKSFEQQIDEVVEGLKVIYAMCAKSKEEAEKNKRQLDIAGHEVKALSAIINEGDGCKAIIEMILSRMT